MDISFSREQRSVGVDISENAIHVVALYKVDGKFRLSGTSFQVLKSSIVRQGVIINSRLLQLSLRAALTEAGVSNPSLEKIQIAIPTTQVHFHTFQATNVPLPELQTEVQKEAIRVFPIESECLAMSWIITGHKKDLLDIQIIGTNSRAIREWVSMYGSLGIRMNDLHTGQHAIIRGLGLTIVSATSVVVDCDSVSTAIVAVAGDKILHSLSFYHHERIAVDERARRICSAIKHMSKNGGAAKKVIFVGDPSDELHRGVATYSGLPTTVGLPFVDISGHGKVAAAYVKAVGLSTMGLRHHSDLTIRRESISVK